MGNPTYPDPGEYEYGRDCDYCTGENMALWAPGKTPKYVEARFETETEGTKIWILEQHWLYECDWEFIHAGMAVEWRTIMGEDIGTLIYAWWPPPYTRWFFWNHSGRFCTSGGVNMSNGEFAWGGHCRMRWGSDITEAAYLAQF